MTMKKYHAHIYFEHYQRPLAEKLVSGLLQLGEPELRLWKFHDLKVGPHFLPMAEVHLSETNLKKVLHFLNINSGGLSILVHEDSGDDFKDHEHPIWVGPSLPIDFDFFHKVKAEPTLSVH